jgi:hypothetical protein
MVSCEKEALNDLQTIVGEGEVVTQNLSLDNFSQIEMNGVANLYITVGSPQQVTVIAQQNIIDVLTWEVFGETLSIGLKDQVSVQNHKEIRFEIALDALESLIHDGVGDILLEGIENNYLEIDYRGVGSIQAYGYPLEHCTVLSSGTGNCSVWVQQTLDVEIASLGNVLYKGHPQINCNDDGLGELINDN